MQPPHHIPAEPKSARLSGPAMGALSALFLAGCAAGGYWVYRLVASSPAPGPAVAVAVPVRDAGAGEQPAWARALNEIFAAGQVKANPGRADGGVILSLPSKKLVVRQERPRPRRRPRRRASPGPAVASPPDAAMSAAPAVIPDPAHRTPRARVVMFTTSWCGACKVARAWLRSRRIAYLERDVEKDPRAAQELRRLNPAGGVPTFVINGYTQVGFSPGRINYLLRMK